MTEQVDAAFVAALGAMAEHGVAEPASLGEHLTARRAVDLFEAQATSRHLDLAARWLRLQGKGFYTIGSSGHEGNAAVAAALRPTDPAMLHYRSGAFYVARAQQVPGTDAVRDVLLGLVAAADDPISGGRHKVFGRQELAVVPQTSTIASHLPRALGTAFSVDRATKLGVASAWPADAVVVASFGDASANHSTATGAVNAAVQVSSRGIPVPLLLVCEDNGLGISVPTPPGWVEQAYGHRPGLRYLAADGADLVACVEAATELAGWVRARRRPALLHLRTVRLMGHAGSDLESAYRRPAEIAADLARDPVLATARLLVGSGTLTAEEVLARYEDVGARVRVVAEEVADVPRLTSAAAVMAPIAARSPDQVARAASVGASPERRLEVFGGELPETAGPMTFAQQVNRTLLDLLAADPGVLVFGEDVARKGGVYGVTRGLQRRIGPARVFDTLLDEQTVLGLGLGAGLSGLLPVPEIQYLAYLHNAEDQLRGEAATLPFFSAGRYRNPMVVRVAAYGYQKGFGGHFHNDNAVGGAARRPRPRRGLALAAGRRRRDAPHLRGGRSGRRHGLGVPGAHRAVPLDGPARGRRRALGRPLRRTGRVGRGARADRLGAHPRRRRRPHGGHLRERGTDEPARRRAVAAQRHRRPGRRPALARPAPGRGRAARGGGHRRRPGRGRDAAERRRLGGRRHGAGRRRLRRRRRARHQPGQLRPAR